MGMGTNIFFFFFDKQSKMTNNYFLLEYKITEAHSCKEKTMIGE